MKISVRFIETLFKTPGCFASRCSKLKNFNQLVSIFNHENIWSTKRLCSNLAVDVSKNKSHFLTHEIQQNINCDTNKEKIDVIIKEIEMAKSQGKFLPEFLTVNDVEELARLETRSQRLKYLKFLFKKEKLKLSKIIKREKKRKAKENKSENAPNESTQYGLGKNTLFLNIRRRSILKFYDKRLANAVLFGQKIVIDMDYDDFMWKKERRDCAAQLRLLYSINRANLNPYNLYFCNVKPSAYCMKYLKEEMTTIDDSFISLTETSYTDIFPKECLVYLSPHARETLKDYDHKAVYIIGAFVDTVKRENISLRKAEAEGIKSYSLPLDDYILWGTGSRSLSINQVFEIMLRMKNTGDWSKAFTCVPSRKIRRLEPEDDEIQQYLKDKIYVLNTSKRKKEYNLH